MSLPWEPSDPIDLTTPTMQVDLRRCTGCHACSIACKVEHTVPLGEFRMRVRWMASPEDGTMAFLPLFDAQTCDYGASRRAVGMQPACIAACPTAALTLVEATEPAPEFRPLGNPGDSHPGVRYRGLAEWQEGRINTGVALHPDDEDIIYEQGPA